MCMTLASMFLSTFPFTILHWLRAGSKYSERSGVLQHLVIGIAPRSVCLFAYDLSTAMWERRDEPRRGPSADAHAVGRSTDCRVSCVICVRADLDLASSSEMCESRTDAKRCVRL